MGISRLLIFDDHFCDDAAVHVRSHLFGVHADSLGHGIYEVVTLFDELILVFKQLLLK